MQCFQLLLELSVYDATDTKVGKMYLYPKPVDFRHCGDGLLVYPARSKPANRNNWQSILSLKGPVPCR